jgi:hypothetical protein
MVLSKTPPFSEATRIESQVAHHGGTQWSLRVRSAQPAPHSLRTRNSKYKTMLTFSKLNAMPKSVAIDTVPTRVPAFLCVKYSRRINA